MSDEIKNLAAALVAAQAEFPVVPKRSANPFYKSKYADLPSIVETVKPILHKHGLAVSQFVSNRDGEPTLRTYLIHSSGQYITHEMPLMLAKQDPQAQGSAITYARRYALSAALSVVSEEDDDGNSASDGYRTAEKWERRDAAGKAFITASQAGQLMTRAKNLGYDTRDTANGFLRDFTGLENWTNLLQEQFGEVKAQLEEMVLDQEAAKAAERDA